MRLVGVTVAGLELMSLVMVDPEVVVMEAPKMLTHVNTKTATWTYNFNPLCNIIYHVNKCSTSLADRDFIHSLIKYGNESYIKFRIRTKFNFA
ncbi:hypothetical protein VIGAN_06264300 [Vigna angularis var. angularis]|uniref:Uncharacterized protein n=1 Tax=Vigna angularis var. angularis TaxID=157739 RepID=A0A0S3SEV1_PHAAN|nr:hypothetical protein VIGAN_06264300 [Vigna angularis var. angularis]